MESMAAHSVTTATKATPMATASVTSTATTPTDQDQWIAFSQQWLLLQTAPVCLCRSAGGGESKGAQKCRRDESSSHDRAPFAKLSVAGRGGRFGRFRATASDLELVAFTARFKNSSCDMMVEVHQLRLTLFDLRPVRPERQRMRRPSANAVSQARSSTLRVKPRGYRNAI
jgi:hypothetical protein